MSPPPKLRGWAEGFIEKSKTNNMVIIYHTMKTQINLLCSGGAPPPFLSPAAITGDTARTLRPHLAEIQKGHVDLGESSAAVPKPLLPLSPPCRSPAPRPEVVGRAGETPPKKSGEGFGAPCVLQERDGWYCIRGEPARVEDAEAAGPPGGGPGLCGGLAHRGGGLAAGLAGDTGTAGPCTLDGCVEGWQLQGHGGGRSHCSRCQPGADGWASLESTQ